ncbi:MULTISPECIES: hypothetical protein [Eikenella]|uniref:Transposase n=1 Tax=Eikenella exigua TaxID=2528037 RepID=A0AAX1F975_9NEIS|nr:MULTISPECIES: hypothetical protein [Eikenella]QED92646.1 hypothetical protein EZJ17_08545 [Eikenella exigua]
MLLMQGVAALTCLIVKYAFIAAYRCYIKYRRQLQAYLKTIRLQSGKYDFSNAKLMQSYCLVREVWKTTTTAFSGRGFSEWVT